jgi:hypothetical protein
MKRRAFIILLVLSLLVSASGVAAMAADESTVATIDGTAYTSLQAAVDAVYNKQVDGNSTIVLEKDTTEAITVNCDVYVDLNGNDIASVTVTAGTFYGTDSQTVDFTVEDGNGYGIIGTYTGNVQAEYSPEDDGHGWLMFGDNGTNTSFHYVQLRITDMTLHPQNEEGKYNPGVSYKSICAGDEVVEANVECFGIALSVAGIPGEIENEKCGYSVFDDFVAGEAGNAGQSTMLKGIIKESYASLINKRNAAMKVYGRPYIMIGQKYIYGKCEARDLKDQVEGANRIWTKLNADQKEGLEGLSAKYTKLMGSWDLSAVGAEYNYVVEDAVTWYDEFVNLPIANADMTEAELRQLVFDYFRLHLSIRWTPNETFRFIDYENDHTTLATENVFEGIPYCMSAAYHVVVNEDGTKSIFDTNGAEVEYKTVNKVKDFYVKGTENLASAYGMGTGNLYKMLNYYNPATGVLDVANMGTVADKLDILTSNCSGGLLWAWGRVSNKTRMFSSNHYVPSNGALPVGNYTFDEYKYTAVSPNSAGKMEINHIANAVQSIIDDNGLETMFESYAQLQLGDGLLTEGHVRMCSGIEVKRDGNGKILPNESYVWYIDMNSNASTDRYIDGTNSNLDAMRQKYTYTNGNGYFVRKLGGLVDDPIKGNKISFSNLAGDFDTVISIGSYEISRTENKPDGKRDSKGYIPVTIPEFCEPEEIEDYKNNVAAKYFENADETRKAEWNTYYAPGYDEIISKATVEPGQLISTGNNLETLTSISVSDFFKKGGAMITNYVQSNYRLTVLDRDDNVLAEENPPVGTSDRSHSVKINKVTAALRELTSEKLTTYVGDGNKIKLAV